MINKKNLKKKKFRLKKDADCSSISIVSSPAIESSFQLFSAIDGKEMNELFSVDSEKMRITGLAMRADYEMLRKDEESGEYYLGYFDAESIEKYAQAYFKNQHNTKANFEHQKKFSNKLFVYESYIVKTEKEAEAFKESLNIDEIKQNDWLVTYQVTDEKLWEDIKNGDFSGFSVEVEAFTFQNIEEEELEFSLEDKIKWIMKTTKFSDIQKELIIKSLMKNY